MKISCLIGRRFLFVGLGKEKDEDERMNLKDFRSLRLGETCFDKRPAEMRLI